MHDTSITSNLHYGRVTLHDASLPNSGLWSRVINKKCFKLLKYKSVCISIRVASVRDASEVLHPACGTPAEWQVSEWRQH